MLVLLIATARWSTDRLFDGQILLLLGLALGLAGALAGHLTRGCLSGTGQFKGYGTYLGADGFIRVLGAVCAWWWGSTPPARSAWPSASPACWPCRWR